MPYADPKKQKAANRANQRKSRARRGMTLESLADAIQDVDSLPEPPSREVLLKALGVQALEGNVPAIRLLLEEYRRDGENATDAGKSFVDQLAERRSRRAVSE